MGKLTETRHDVAVSIHALGLVLEGLGLITSQAAFYGTKHHGLAGVGIEARRKCKCKRAT